MKTFTPQDDYDQQLVAAWEEVYKKGQLTLWVLLALKDGPKYAGDIKEFLMRTTDELVSVDDRSLYRALRRYYASELVTYKSTPSNNGPDRKLYALTPLGHRVLQQFIQRNISLFYRRDIKTLMENPL